MNKDRIGIALIGCGRSTLYACGKDKGELIAIEPRTEPTTMQQAITYHARPKLCPIIDSSFLGSEKMPGMGHSSLNGRYYEKKVAKRRKKNKNKKTHRK